MMPLYVPPTEVRLSELIEALSAEVTAMYTRAEQDVLNILARRMYRDLAERPDDTARLMHIRELRAEAEKVLADIPDDVAERVIRIAAREGTAAAVAQLGLASYLPPTSPFTTTAAFAVAQTALDLQNKLDQLHLRILRLDADEYQRLIGSHVPGVLLGTEGTLQAQRRAVADWLANAYPTFIDKGGRPWRVGSYVEMATRTAVQRAYTDAAVHRMQQAGIGLVSVVVGTAACEDCSEWIGKVLSTDGTPAGRVEVPNSRTGKPMTVTVAATLDDARAQGLMHPNCRCTVVAHLPGFEVPEAATTYDPALEKARDRQRALEREIRADKRRLSVTRDPDDVAGLKRDIRATQKKIREHIAEHDLPRMPWREQLHFADGKTPAA